MPSRNKYAHITNHSRRSSNRLTRTTTLCSSHGIHPLFWESPCRGWSSGNLGQLCVASQDAELTLSSATKNMPSISENTTAARRTPWGYSSAAPAFPLWLAMSMPPCSELGTRVHKLCGGASAVARFSESVFCLSIVDEVARGLVMWRIIKDCPFPYCEIDP